MIAPHEGCDEMLIDEAVWPEPSDRARPFAPGTHSIRCGIFDGEPIPTETGIGFDIPAGRVFRFDYWGP